MVAPFPSQVSKFRPRLPVAAQGCPLPTTHHSPPTLFLPVLERSTPLLPITPVQPQQFHAITHSFAQRRAAIPPISMASALFLSLRGCTPLRPRRLPTQTRSSLRALCVALFPILGCLKPANSFVCIGLEPLCRLFALFSALVSFVFNRLQPLFRKHPGWGVSTLTQASESRPVARTDLYSPCAPASVANAVVQPQARSFAPPESVIVSATPVPRAYCAMHLCPPTWSGRTESLFRA